MSDDWFHRLEEEFGITAPPREKPSFHHHFSQRSFSQRPDFRADPELKKLTDMYRMRRLAPKDQAPLEHSPPKHHSIELLMRDCAAHTREGYQPIITGFKARPADSHMLIQGGALHADLAAAELSHHHFSKTDFSWSRLNWSGFTHCRFEHCGLHHISTRLSWFRHCGFENSVMHYADLRGATFSHCTFSQTDFTKVRHFEKALFRDGCVFESDCILTPAQRDHLKSQKVIFTDAPPREAQTPPYPLPSTELHATAQQGERVIGFPTQMRHKGSEDPNQEVYADTATHARLIAESENVVPLTPSKKGR
jgi:hypothetical protein